MPSSFHERYQRLDPVDSDWGWFSLSRREECLPDPTSSTRGSPSARVGTWLVPPVHYSSPSSTPTKGSPLGPRTMVFFPFVYTSTRFRGFPRVQIKGLSGDPGPPVLNTKNKNKNKHKDRRPGPGPCIIHESKNIKINKKKNHLTCLFTYGFTLSYFQPFIKDNVQSVICKNRNV